MPRQQSLRRLRRIKIRGPLPARCFRTTKSDRWFCSKDRSGVWVACHDRAVRSIPKSWEPCPDTGPNAISRCGIPYQLLYRLEMQNEIEYKGLRRKLNGCYENFTALLGDLNKKENAAFILNDPGGREVLGLERFVEGRKQLSDILRRPVSFDPNEIKHVDTAAEALAASLNKFGRVKFSYMESLASRSRQELIDELGDRIFYNPMVKGFEIRERLVAGNVVAKAE